MKPIAVMRLAQVAAPPGGGGGGTSLLDGLVHWYELNEASGTRADSVGACNLSVATGTVTSATTPIGTGAAIASGAFLAGSSGLADLSDTDFTIAGFFTGAGSTTGIFCRSGDINNRQVWALVESGSFLFIVSTSGSGNTAVATVPSVNPANPHFFIAWRDRTANTINVQIDMGTIASASFSGASSLYEVAGLNQIIGSLTTTGVYNGGATVDNVGVWNRVLTSAERTALYNGGAWRDFAEL